MKTCAVPTCDRPAAARGWCRAHYWRWRRSGDVQASMAIGDPGTVRGTLVDPLPTYSDAELDAIRERVDREASWLTACILVGMANDVASL